MAILFIDDDEKILKLLERVLILEPYQKFFTTDPEQAFQILKEQAIEVVVSDMQMPKMNGIKTSAKYTNAFH